MQNGINKVILVGNLGNEPEVKNTTQGQTITRISLATSDTWKDKNTGEAKTKTEWHRVVLFGKLAEIAGQYLRKGSKVYFEGKLQTNKWQDQNGQDRYTTEIVVDSFTGVMQMLDSKGDNSTSQSNNNPIATPFVEQQNNNQIMDNFDDVPF